MSNLKIFRNGINWPFKSFIFPGGEIGVKLEISPVAFASKTGLYANTQSQTILARLTNSSDIMELVMLTDALRRIDKTPIELVMPYIPYARQDRVCDCGEAFSLKAFSRLINSLGFSKITVVDPHSNVSDGVFDNLEIITQFQIINKWTKFISRVMGAKFISPDAGSNKKVSDLAKFFNHNDFVRADKLRDLSTGKIIETLVYKDDFLGQDVVIADDICDGGRTFIELAKILKKKNCGKIILYITHGIFSQGIEALLSNGIDEIWFTDSFRTDLKETDRVHIFNLESII